MKSVGGDRLGGGLGYPSYPYANATHKLIALSYTCQTASAAIRSDRQLTALAVALSPTVLFHFYAWLCCLKQTA